MYRARRPCISIHAPAKGATVFSSTLRSLEVLFQFTLPRRERPVLPLQPAAAAPISIHAPAKGATTYSRTEFIPIHNFNSRSREGSDKTANFKLSQFIDFNPRSREGSDQKDIVDTIVKIDFNPRSREGSDSFRFYKNFCEFTHFNPRSREGSDECCNAAPVLKYISIHAPAKGATKYLIGLINPKLFQSTLPRRERRKCK